MILFSPDCILESIYIHWPFCPYKCHFCPFVALASQDQFMEQYHAALCQEMLDFAKQEGEINRSVNTRALAQLLVAAMEGATMLAKTKKDAKAFRNCARSLRDLLDGTGR